MDKGVKEPPLHAGEGWSAGTSLSLCVQLPWGHRSRSEDKRHAAETRPSVGRGPFTDGRSILCERLCPGGGQVKATTRAPLLPSEKQKAASVGEDVEKSEPSDAVGGRERWCSRVENGVTGPQSLEIELPRDPGST